MKHTNRKELFACVDATYREASALLDRNYDAILEKLKDDYDGGKDQLFLSEWRKLVIKHASGCGAEYINAFFGEIDPNRGITTAMRKQAGDELDRLCHLFLSRQKTIYRDLLFNAGFTGNDDMRLWVDDLGREVQAVTGRMRAELDERVYAHNRRPDLRRQNQLAWLFWSAGIVGALLAIGVLWAVVFT